MLKTRHAMKYLRAINRTKEECLVAPTSRGQSPIQCHFEGATSNYMPPATYNVVHIDGGTYSFVNIGGGTYNVVNIDGDSGHKMI